MLNEAEYMEVMKNCSKWNEQSGRERRMRFRHPFYDHQTGVAQRLNSYSWKTKEMRRPCSDPNIIVRYEENCWTRTGTLDSLEMKMFLRDNPLLENALGTHNSNTNVVQVPEVVDIPPSLLTNDSPPKLKRSIYEEIEEEDSDDFLSDVDEWITKKKGKKVSAPPTKKTPKAKGGRPSSAAGSKGPASTTKASASTTKGSISTNNKDKKHTCTRCKAVYKSAAGLTYHNAYVHNEFSTVTEATKLLTVGLDISTTCDLCQGDANINKNSQKPEQLVNCHDCGRSGHPSCLTFNENVLVVINRFGWQCIECKSCTICGTSENDDQLLFCDDCDRGYHLYCLKPALKKAPDNEYSCRLCQDRFGAQASAPAT